MRLQLVIYFFFFSRFQWRARKRNKLFALEVSAARSAAASELRHGNVPRDYLV